jgi:RNA polymerase sigma-70 factor (ECF subfamily)
LNLAAGPFVWTGVIDGGAALAQLEETGADAPGRAAAFARLADARLGHAYRLAGVLLGSHSEAEDAVQDAAIRAWEQFRELRDQSRFDAWFDRILVNGCRDRLRRRARVRLVEVAVEGDGEAGGRSVLGGHDPVARFPERDALRSALDSLTADQRTVIVLRYFADLSIEEIARRTGDRPGTVKSRLHYALAALRASWDAAARLPEESAR